MVKDILIGIAIGDAFGAGLEFQDRNWIKKNVDFNSFVNRRPFIPVSEEKIEVFVKNYQEWDYTDDTEMTIGLMNALISEREFTTDLLIEKWVDEYQKGVVEKGYGRNGHGSMSWFYNNEMTIDEIRDFQKNRTNPGNAPAMRSVPLGLLNEKYIEDYAIINANATHPNLNAVLSSETIARATEYMLIKKDDHSKIVEYCMSRISLNHEYETYFNQINSLPKYSKLEEHHFNVLCGSQPIKEPYFLPGINGVPSDSKYTAGCVLYILKNSKNAFDALKKSILLGGDVDSVASICTGIMSGRYGLSSLPSFMCENVEGKDYLETVANKFESKFLI